MTFLELCKRLRQEVGAAGTGPASVAGQHGEYARLVGWIQQAWLEIQLEKSRWRFAWTRAEIDIETAYREYSPPADFDEWDADSLKVNGHRVSEMEWRLFRERYPSDSGATRPIVITRLPNGNLMLDTAPAEDGLLTFEYWRRPQRLTENNDVPRMHSDYHMLIVYRAMASYAFYENAEEVAARAAEGQKQIMHELLLRELPEMDLAGPLA